MGVTNSGPPGKLDGEVAARRERHVALRDVFRPHPGDDARRRGGRDHIRPDPVLGAFERDHARQSRDARLRRRVVRLVGQPEEAGARRREHEAAVALVAHDAERRLAHVERAEEVGAEHPHQLLVRHLSERLVAQDAGVVHHDVEAPELTDGGVDDRRATVGVGDRLVRGDRPSSRGRDLVDHRVGGAGGSAGAVDRAAQVVHDDRRAAPPELERVRPAQPVPGAGHDDHPAVERDVAGPCRVGHRRNVPPALAAGGVPTRPAHRHFTRHKESFYNEQFGSERCTSYNWRSRACHRRSLRRAVRGTPPSRCRPRVACLRRRPARCRGRRSPRHRRPAWPSPRRPPPGCGRAATGS